MEKMNAAREAEELKRYVGIRRYATDSHIVTTSSRLYRYDNYDDEECDEQEYQQAQRRQAEDEWTAVDRKATKSKYADYEEEADEDYDY